MDFKLSQFIRYPGYTLCTYCRCKSKFQLAPLFYNAWHKGKSQKVGLLISNLERRLSFLVATTVHDL